MSSAILRWVVLFISVFVASQLSFLGISYNSWTDLLVAALVLSIVNSFVKPLLLLISLPLIILTLGFFILIVNALLLYFVSWLVPGFHVPTFWSALGGSLVISVVSMFLGSEHGPRRKTRVFQDRMSRSDNGPVIDI
jgi:putative membrane protein